MATIKNIKVEHLEMNLRRANIFAINKQPVWDVLNKDKTIRKAVVYKRHTVAMRKRIGYQQFQEQYWICEVFWHHKVLIGPTRISVLNQLWHLEHPNHYNPNA